MYFCVRLETPLLTSFHNCIMYYWSSSWVYCSS